MSPWRAIPLALLLGVVVRVPFWIEALRTPVDGDTAIVGLMARHPGEGTTLWGQPYGSPLDAWVAAPFVAVLGHQRRRRCGCPTSCWRSASSRSPTRSRARSIPRRGAARGGARGVPAAVLPAALRAAAAPLPDDAAALGAAPVCAARAGRRLADGRPPRAARCSCWALLGGLALWTHLMSASAVAAPACWLVLLLARAAAACLACGARRALAAASAPCGRGALSDPRGDARSCSVESRARRRSAHLQADRCRACTSRSAACSARTCRSSRTTETSCSATRGWAAALTSSSMARCSCCAGARRAAASPAARCCLPGGRRSRSLAFPFPLRSAPHTIRLPDAALPARGGARRLGGVAARRRRAARLDAGARRWRRCTSLPARACSRPGARTDRAEPPFLLPDLAPVRAAARAQRRAPRLRVVRAGLPPDLRERRADRGVAALERALPPLPAAATSTRCASRRTWPGC